MQRRKLLKQAASCSLLGFSNSVLAQDFGKSLGYPTGWGPIGQKKMQTGWPDYLIGNFSSGFEHLFDFKIVKASSKSNVLTSRPRQYKLNFFQSLSDYQRQNGKPGVLIAKGSNIYYENYEFERTSSMRFNGKSMSKSVISLLCGLAFDLGAFSSLEDPIEKYDNRLKGKPLGPVTLRNALNMSSGVDVCRDLCSSDDHYEKFERDAFSGPPHARAKKTDHDAVLINWKYGVDLQSRKYNYTPIEPQLLAMAISGATGLSLTEFTEKYLWGPIGAEADSAWLVDSKGIEHAPAGFNACLRDWGRLGLLVAQNGAANGKQVISEGWFKESKTFRPDENYIRPGQIHMKPRGEGYKFLFHRPADENLIRFGGDNGQMILADTKSGTVLVILGVTENAKEYFKIFDLAKADLGGIT
jgi:CubicO group peptidase (beta-lactamase class C family)